MRSEIPEPQIAIGETSTERIVLGDLEKRVCECITQLRWNERRELFRRRDDEVSLRERGKREPREYGVCLCDDLGIGLSIREHHARDDAGRLARIVHDGPIDHVRRNIR